MSRGCCQPNPQALVSWKTVPVIVITLLCLGLWLGQWQHRAVDYLFKPAMDTTDRTLAFELLTTLCSVLEAHNLTYMIYAGTLLGAYRHQGFIPWDDDIDILLADSQKEATLDALKLLEPKYKHLKRGFDKFYKDDPLKNQWYYTRMWPFIDLMFYTENETYIFAEARTWPKDRVFPLKRRLFEGLTFPVPRYEEEFLTTLYRGKDVFSMCRSRTYSHYYGLSRPYMTVPCQTLYSKYHFAHKNNISYTQNVSV